MKLLLALSVTLILVFVIIQLYARKSQQDIETYPYTVIKTYEGFEIRQYESRLFTSVKLSSNDYSKVSGQGFSILAGYIFGGNATNEKIAMTSPVAMTLDDSMTMMFMVPKDNENNLPKPNDNQIQFKEEPAKIVAAISFGGWANQDKIAQYKKQLVEGLQVQNIAHTNQFYFLGYNAPYETSNRRNEVIVVLDSFSLE
jgi:predicted lactoylglutathione lyase